MAFDKVARRAKIKRRIRKNISGTAAMPRLSVFRSNKQIYAQIIDDVSGNTIVAASSRDKSFEGQKITKIEQAKLVGSLIGEKAKKMGVESVKFDRGGFIYHGRIKALAEAARESGLKF